MRLFLSMSMMYRTCADLTKRSLTRDQDGHEDLSLFGGRKIMDLMESGGLIHCLLAVLVFFPQIKYRHYVSNQTHGFLAPQHLSAFDLEALMACHATLVKRERFDAYTQIGDLCLFVTGMLGANGARYTPGAKHLALSMWASGGAHVHLLAAIPPRGLGNLISTDAPNDERGFPFGSQIPATCVVKLRGPATPLLVHPIAS